LGTLGLGLSGQAFFFMQARQIRGFFFFFFLFFLQALQSQSFVIVAFNFLFYISPFSVSKNKIMHFLCSKCWRLNALSLSLFYDNMPTNCLCKCFQNVLTPCELGGTGTYMRTCVCENNIHITLNLDVCIV
jgi:hypothetical protein